MKPILLISCLFLSVFISAQPGESSNVPRVINYQGHLTTNVGGQIADGNYTMTFTIYDALTGGNSLWTSGQQTVKVSQGLFTYLLGSSSALSNTLFSADTTRYLGITVGIDPEISPRTKITSVAYALQSLKADSALYAVNAQQSITSDTADYALSGADNWTVIDSILFTNNDWGLVRGNAENVIACTYNRRHTMINLGEACTTGQDSPYHTVWSAVYGGSWNAARGAAAVVVTGSTNKASADQAFICDGYRNSVGGEYGFIANGEGNAVNGDYGIVANGINNINNGEYGFIGNGFENLVGGQYSSVINGQSCINNGVNSCILGGEFDSLLSGSNYSLIFGRSVYIENPYRVALFNSEYIGRLGINRDDHDGGIGYPIQVGTIGTSNGYGAYLTWQGVWTSTSSRDFKENLASIERNRLFESISRLGLFSYNFKNSDERHIGPMAEDFVAEFNVGVMREDGTRENQYLAAGDVAGVALMGVKELISENQELRQMIEELKKEIAAIKAGK